MCKGRQSKEYVGALILVSTTNKAYYFSVRYAMNFRMTIIRDDFLNAVCAEIVLYESRVWK